MKLKPLLLLCTAISINGEDDSLVGTGSVSGNSDGDITPESFKSLKNKVGLLESSITALTSEIKKLGNQNEELYKSHVELMFERIAKEFGKVNEQLSTFGNRISKFENTSDKSIDKKRNETKLTESNLLSDSCGGVIEEKELGEIIYKEGKRYSNDEECVWTVVVPDAEIISFQLVTNGFEECCDYITLNSIDQVGELTGPTLNLTSLNRSASVRGPRVNVKFSSDNSMTGNGFTVRFRIRPKDDAECGGAIIGDKGKISYNSGLEYLNNERCVWILHSPKSKSIKLKLLEVGFETCCDYLLVNTIDPETGLLRNDTQKLTKTLKFEESLVVIVFYSDPSSPGTGFSLEFSSSGENPDPEINFIVKHLSEPNGTIEYPNSEWNEGGENNNIYVIGFSQMVQFPETFPTSVNWKHGTFQKSTDSCVYDTLTIYEQVNYWREVTQFPNQNQTDCQTSVTVPQENDLLTIQRHSLIAIFKPLSHKNSENVTRFSFSYDSEPRADSICGGISEPLKAELGQVSYKAKMDYTINEDCTWTVQVPQAEKILFSLITTGLEECCDRIFVYPHNNRAVSFPLTSENRTVSVEGPTATVSFTSDGSVTGLGFLLHYQKET
ncbi:unnamed protein product [Orchesella dallaii]|uniref:CUB domain-containing protein n=1 Tax=Orchesella dallaii TaxID=48710 RepID=A0ABP1PSS6_9HEXA